MNERINDIHRILILNLEDDDDDDEDDANDVRTKLFGAMPPPLQRAISGGFQRVIITESDDAIDDDTRDSRVHLKVRRQIMKVF